MIHLNLTLEDTLIVADRGVKTWSGRIADAMTGKEYHFVDWTDEQMGAIVGLAVGGEEWNDTAIPEGMYILAEPLCGKMPPEIRPIP